MDHPKSHHGPPVVHGPSVENHCFKMNNKARQYQNNRVIKQINDKERNEYKYIGKGQNGKDNC